MRKDSGFEVMDRINVTITGNEKLAEVVKKNENAISTKVLADSISFDGSCENSKEWNINGEDVTIGVKKINS
jgi:isoleucyl-tRNA synthetase